MEVGASTAMLAVGAGLASVLSPCVLPVVPVVMAGADKSDRVRPLLVVAGLAITFVAMGVVSSLFGVFLVGRTRYIELGGAVVIMLIGLLVLLDVNVFKQMYRLSNIRVKGEGRFSGLVLGMALGLVWVPCIGPMLSGILTMVGTSGQLLTGVVLLGFYSLGLAIPMLVIAYSSHLMQSRIKSVARHETMLRYISGGILLVFGAYQIVFGNLAFSL